MRVTPGVGVDGCKKTNTHTRRLEARRVDDAGQCCYPSRGPEQGGMTTLEASQPPTVAPVGKHYLGTMYSSEHSKSNPQ